VPAFARRLVATLVLLAATVAPTFGATSTALAAPSGSSGTVSVFFKQGVTNLDVAEFAAKYALTQIAPLGEAFPVATFEAEDPESVLPRLRADRLVRVASIVQERTLASDPLYADQWWLKNTGQSFILGVAWSILRSTGVGQVITKFAGTIGKDTKWEAAVTGAFCGGGPCTGQGVTVAVVDTGIDDSHPDLTGQLSAASVSLAAGYGPKDDDVGHGTFIAGLIAARKDNGIGLVGIAPNAQLLAVKVATEDGFVGDTAQAIAYAADAGASVVNLSYTNPTLDEVERAVIELATASPYNMVVVAAAGNSGDKGNPLLFPAAYPHVVSVGAVDSEGRVANFSQRNSAVDVTAPGMMVFSALANTIADRDCEGTAFSTAQSVIEYLTQYGCIFFDGVRDDTLYEIGNGTSYSAPLVAGAAALAKQKWPSINGDQFEALVRATADDDASGNGPDSSYGAGTLNLQRLVSFNFPPTIDVGSVALTIPEVTNSGAESTAAVARVANMEGVGDIASVTADFSALGIPQPVAMMLTSDLTYGTPAQVIPASVAVGQYTVTVTARDSAGGTASATAPLHVRAHGASVPSFPSGGTYVAPTPQPTPDLAVTISSPDGRKLTTRKRTLALAGTIGRDVAAVEVNGEAASVDVSAQTWSARVSLRSGNNHIEVKSFDLIRAASEVATLNAVLDRTAPGPVTNLRAEVSGSKTLLRWDAPSDEDVAGYHVYSISAGAREPVSTSRTTAATVAGRGVFAVVPEDVAGNEGDVSTAPRAGSGTVFTDVPPEHFASSPIATLLARGIVQEGVRFRPDDAITRAEFAKLLTLARGERGSAAMGFTDVPSTFSLAEYVGAVVRLRWASGQGDQFFPTRPISRMEAARMLVNAVGLEPAESPTFTDVQDARERGIVAAIARAGIATGQGTRFMPHRALTRAEAAKMISLVLR
jgi:subtilisin family serine protease